MFIFVSFSFNRTTVECKCISINLVKPIYTRFNRTTVECKYGEDVEVDINSGGFNRTTVECKLKALQILIYTAWRFNRTTVECKSCLHLQRYTRFIVF